MLHKVISQIIEQKQAIERANAYRELIRKEAEIGGQLFGIVPSGHQRSFFCLDERTWVWHEQWQDNKGKTQSFTTNYSVRPNGVVKTLDGHNFQALSLVESVNLRDAIKLYYQKVMSSLYRQLA
jgi:hypothetical protein